MGYQNKEVKYWRELHRVQLYTDITVGVAGFAAMFLVGRLAKKSTDALLSVTSRILLGGAPLVLYHYGVNLPTQHWGVIRACDSMPQCFDDHRFHALQLQHEALPIWRDNKRLVHNDMYPFAWCPY